MKKEIIQLIITFVITFAVVCLTAQLLPAQINNTIVKIESIDILSDRNIIHYSDKTDTIWFGDPAFVWKRGMESYYKPTSESLTASEGRIIEAMLTILDDCGDIEYNQYGIKYKLKKSKSLLFWDRKANDAAHCQEIQEQIMSDPYAIEIPGVWMLPHSGGGK